MDSGSQQCADCDRQSAYGRVFYGEAGRQAYDFLWVEFADWYVEIAKVQLQEGGGRAWTTLAVLRQVLDDGLRLLHPYIPYVTETWQQLRAACLDADNGLVRLRLAEALIIAQRPNRPNPPIPPPPQARARADPQHPAPRGREYDVPPARRIAATIEAGANAAFYASRLTLSAFRRVWMKRS